MGMINSLTSSLAGMKTAQAQLDLISRNVSNVDTEGYSRKVANQKNVIIGGFSQGVSLGTVTRQVDQGLLKSYLVSSAASSSLSAQSEYVSKAETLLGSPQDNNSVAANVASLQAAFEKFATDVSSSSSRYELISQAETITNRLNYISKELQKLRADADIAIADEVKEVNSILEKLNDLNNEIVKYSVKGSNDTADLEDQRDQLLRSLSEKIDINYFTRDNGEMVIQTTDGITLLDDQVHPLSHNSISQASSITMYEAGNIDGIYVDGKDITSQIKSGSLAGLIEVRDSTLSSLQSQLDELAGSLKDQINQIHNRGTSYPDTPDTLTGSRTFISPSTQTISIENGDVRFVIFDDSGKQVATASLKGDLGFTSGVIDDTDVNGNRPDDSTSLAGTLERWLKESPEGPQLQDAKVYVNSDGKLVIETGDSNYGLSIIDESGSAAGSAQQDATIRFDANGDGTFDSTTSGFSYFFGLNDFFTDTAETSIYDSNVLNVKNSFGLRNPVTLNFANKTNGELGSIVVKPGDTIQDIANAINNDETLSQSLNASVIKNGSGYMLRIVNYDGSQLEITENAVGNGESLLGAIGLSPSKASSAESIKVRDDLLVTSDLIAGGVPEYDKTTGEYIQNASNNSIANGMAEAFTQSVSFKQCGTISKVTTTLGNYASTFVGNIASQASTLEESASYQQQLTSSIATKEAQVSGVDIDEELGQMIIFQQTYAACAQAFTASKELLDMLLGIVQ